MAANIIFTNKNGDFKLNNPDKYHSLYFPIASEKGIKSAITPTLSGDSKLDQNTFILEPVSIENLHNNRSSRNFCCRLADGNMWSVAGASPMAEMTREENPEDCTMEAGFMCQKISRNAYGLSGEILSFVPFDENAELMHVTLTNTSENDVTFTPFAAIPIYGRSADNIRDHKHVTSLLHRIAVLENAITVKPTLSFDERGHKKNNVTYYVAGLSHNGDNRPVAFYPTSEEYIGESGTYSYPEAIKKNLSGAKAGEIREGKEACGAFKFADVTLKPNESVSYTIFIGAEEQDSEAIINHLLERFADKDAVTDSLEATKSYWERQVNLWFESADNDFDKYMRWVTFQPFLRRIYGCSFLPYHDYGKGGRGWRDLWQDCLALLLMDPKDVRTMLLSNFGGVRLDGTNATIIGSKQGEFVADRNNIARVWMDHGMWPFLTTKLYIEQTGDIEILNEPVAYFRDAFICRGTAHNKNYKIEEGTLQKTYMNKLYLGSVLEHILLEHLCAISELGDNGSIRLRNADWNDAIDMAADKGESVAFTCAYAGNLKDIAKLIEQLAQKTGQKEILLFEEFVEFIKLGYKEDVAYDPKYIEKERHSLMEFTKTISNGISGGKVAIDTRWLCDYLNNKADRLMEHIRANEWCEDSDENAGWLNSYYDNHGAKVEGIKDDTVRMMLTGQVFAIMSGTATDQQVAKICNSADKYLYDEAIGGYRLNTNFNEEKYDMGRMFGFAYGEKENGAVFSHMTVMYGYALYKRGFVKEGYKAIHTLYNASMNFEKSLLFPGVPEYFNSDGRGMYSYLTGAASWYAMTMLTESFGVKGDAGNLKLEPKLLKEQFDEDGEATVSLKFADRVLKVIYENPLRRDYGEYKVSECKLFTNVDGALVALDNKELDCDLNASKYVIIPRNVITELSQDKCNEIIVTLN